MLELSTFPTRMKKGTKMPIKGLYHYQEEAVSQLLSGKHFIIAPTGMGKGAMMMVYADQLCQRTGKSKVLVVTTASKSHMHPNDYELDLAKWCPGSPLLPVSPSAKSLSSSSPLTVISWAKLADWVKANWKAVEDYVVLFDEVAAAKNFSSGRSKAFIKITKRTPHWAGFTATPGENWLHFYPYFAACGLARNKTSFLAEFATVQTYKGYPEIVAWRQEDKLKAMWAKVSYAPDVSIALQELPKESHRVITFSKPKGYATVLKTRQKTASDGGEFLDTTMGLMHYIRQLCFTKDKEQWVQDFLENLGTRAIIFYSYIAEGDRLEEIARKALPKGAKVWRIDGSHHDIPTEETCGGKDVVLCQWQSGSEGLNCQWIDYWVSVSPTYSYSTSIQARGRIQRIGATNPKFYYYLKCERCVEEDIYECLHKKKDFSDENWCIEHNLIKEDNE